MITITKGKDHISVSGHAEYADPGRDIVCAGVSTLVETLTQSFEELTSDLIKYDMTPGAVHIYFGDLSERARLLVDSFFVGVSMIAATYPDNVKII